MINLISNALKFSEPGSLINIKASNLADLAADKQNLSIEVCDNGIGITEADQENLFKPFFRSTDPNSISKNKYGNGLGLSICKMIA